jgi:hypothetical protein
MATVMIKAVAKRAKRLMGCPLMEDTEAVSWEFLKLE